MHTNFKLNRNGEQIGFFESNAKNNVPIDTISFSIQKNDTSYGRISDGDSTWVSFFNPTPGKPNEFKSDTLKLTNIFIDSIAGTSVGVNWETNIPATSTVRFGAQPDQLIREMSNPNLVLQHRIIIDRLIPNQTWYYRVKSSDVYQRETVSDVLNFTTLETTKLHHYEIAVDSIEANQVKISWKTNRPAHSTLYFGLDQNRLEQVLTDSLIVQVHEFFVSELIADTTYFFIVQSTARNEISQTSEILSFSTLNSRDSLDIIYQIEVMPYRSSGFFEDSGWNFGNNGLVRQDVKTTRPGFYQYTFRTKGKAALNIWPTFELSIDDSVLLSEAVIETKYRNYTVSSHLDSGWHSIQIAFINADSLQTCALIGDWLRIEFKQKSTDVGYRQPDKLPRRTLLYQNFPNPANPETQIRYSIPNSSHVLLKIYNLSGQEVRTLVDSEKTAGWYTLDWDGCDNAGQPVASGLYLYRLSAGGRILNRKILILK